MAPRAIAAAVLALSLLVSAAPADADSLAECGQRVIRDWYSGGRVDKVYPLPCYREAIRALPDDVLQYTDATHDIERALAQARRGRLDRPARLGPAQARPAPAAASAAPTRRAPRPSLEPLSRTARATDSQAEKRTSGPGPERVPIRRTPDAARLASGPVPEGRDGGIPYPLIALAALAPVLLVSGLVGALARRRG